MSLRHHTLRWPRLFILPIFCLFLLSLFPAPTHAASATYTVQPGDTLYRIAQAHGVTVAALAAANSIVNPHLIYAGQILTIPDDTVPAGGFDVPAADGDEEADDTTAPGLVHVVQYGETLYRIAVHYGLTVQAVQQANNLANPNVIFPGQELLIPGDDANESGVGLPAPPPPPAEDSKRIVVDKSEQRAYVYEDGELLWTFVISTGMPGSETWEGTFHVRSKIPVAYAYLWSLQMPYWLGFYHTGYLENGFHALPIMSNGAVLWDGYLGTPVSYGCVILSYPDAETLYNWAEIGTEVIVRP